MKKLVIKLFGAAAIAACVAFGGSALTTPANAENGARAGSQNAVPATDISAQRYRRRYGYRPRAYRRGYYRPYGYAPAPYYGSPAYGYGGGYGYRRPGIYLGF